MKTYMTIGLTEDGKAGINISPNLDAAMAFRLLGTLTLHLLNAYYTVATNQTNQTTQSNLQLSKEEQEAFSLGIKESMYDAVDSVISNALNTFYPENPALSLEDEAILELVNKKIEERYESLTDKEKEAYAKAIDEIRCSLQKKI